METCEYKDKNYELKTKTMKIAKLIEAVETSKSSTEAYKNEFALIRAALGDDVVRDIMGTINIDSVDLIEVAKLYNAVIDGYDRDLIEMQREQDLAALDSPALDKIRELADNIKAIKDLADDDKLTK